MSEKLPGTMLDFTPEAARDPFGAVEPLLTVTGGLTLSQVSELTGLETTTIQNWVKRGWVANPRGKRYGEVQLMRIILINIMRGAMQLDEIAEIMTYINGSVEDRSDDIIPDRELFCHLCRVINSASERHVADEIGDLKRLISEELAQYKGPTADATQKLQKALLVMVLAYKSSQTKELAMREYDKIEF